MGGKGEVEFYWGKLFIEKMKVVDVNGGVGRF